MQSVVEVPDQHYLETTARKYNFKKGWLGRFRRSTEKVLIIDLVDYFFTLIVPFFYYLIKSDSLSVHKIKSFIRYFYIHTGILLNHKNKKE